MLVKTIYQISRYLYLWKVPIVPRFLSRLNRFLYSCEIPYSANIHPSVTFAHKALGVVIGPEVVIGANTKILHNVTIGGRGNQLKDPIIGENVLIGAGACILGNILIGNNVSVGANAVVIINVPDDHIAVGVPAHVRKRN